MDIKVIDPQVIVHDRLDIQLLKNLEKYGRVCYKSEDRITEDSAPRFIKSLIKRGHESVIEHEKVTVTFITNRGITHEIVRHRIASYSQESSRYCNYKNQFIFIRPFYFNGRAYDLWMQAMINCAKTYEMLLNAGYRPEQARGVLPNDLKTEIVVTYNLREWRHFFKLRCARAAHPQIRQVAIPTLLEFKERLPVIFDDITYDEEFPATEYAKVYFKEGLI